MDELIQRLRKTELPEAYLARLCRLKKRIKQNIYRNAQAVAGILEDAEQWHRNACILAHPLFESDQECNIEAVSRIPSMSIDEFAEIPFSQYYLDALIEHTIPGRRKRYPEARRNRMSYWNIIDTATISRAADILELATETDGNPLDLFQKGVQGFQDGLDRYPHKAYWRDEALAYMTGERTKRWVPLNIERRTDELLEHYVQIPEGLIKEAIQQYMRKAIRLVPEKRRREILESKYLRGESFSSIGKRTGVSGSRIQDLAQKAKRSLRWAESMASASRLYYLAEALET